MPSVLLGFLSGGVDLLSGNYWSGRGLVPWAGVQLRAGSLNSGYVYVALSGGMTVTSGGLGSGAFNSGGLMDGMQLAPGDAYFVPRLAVGPSGNPNLYALPDAACSGQARLFYEVL